MKVVITLGCTATKLGDTKATRLKAGQKVELEPADAKALIRSGAAARVNSEEGRAASRKVYDTPQRKEAVDPNARQRKRIRELGDDLNGGTPDPDGGAQPGNAGSDAEETETEESNDEFFDNED